MPQLEVVCIHDFRIRTGICRETFEIVFLNRKLCGRLGDLIKQYEVPLSRILHGILEDDHMQ